MDTRIFEPVLEVKLRIFIDTILVYSSQITILSFEACHPAFGRSRTSIFVEYVDDQP